MAAMNGTDYLAPTLIVCATMETVSGQVIDLMQMLETHGLNSKDSCHHLRIPSRPMLISAGIDAVTLPPGIVYTMMDHPGTKIAVDEFCCMVRGW